MVFVRADFMGQTAEYARELTILRRIWIIVPLRNNSILLLLRLVAGQWRSIQPPFVSKFAPSNNPKISSQLMVLIHIHFPVNGHESGGNEPQCSALGRLITSEEETNDVSSSPSTSGR